MKLLTLAFLTLVTAPVAAQPMPTTAPVCPAQAQPIPAELAGWSQRKPLTAATAFASVQGAKVIPGMGVDLVLPQTPTVTYPLRPSHPGGSVSHGGLVSLTIVRAGIYRVAIGSSAWLDLVRGSTALDSVGHGHGPNCSGIRKMVDFKLQPGDYVLQIVGSGTASLPLLIAKLP